MFFLFYLDIWLKYILIPLQLDVATSLSPSKQNVNGNAAGHFLVWPIKSSICRPLIPRIWKKVKQHVGRDSGSLNHSVEQSHLPPMLTFGLLACDISEKLPIVCSHWNLWVYVIILSTVYLNDYTHLSFSHRSKIPPLQSFPPPQQNYSPSSLCSQSIYYAYLPFTAV